MKRFANQVVTIVFVLLFCTCTAGAQTIVPTQTDEIIIDNGTSGKADPGDRIRYKVTIQNTGSPAGTGVQLNVVPDPRTTFVAGTFKSSPLALPDAYTCTGNVPIFVAAPGIKANDFDEGAPGTLSISTATNQATVRGGSVDIFADGSFEYTPPAGYEGDDSFTYTLNDATQAGPGAPVTDVGTVTITISGMIWFINNSAAAGDGRLSSPFNSLGAFNTANGGMTMNNGDVVNPEINETIFLYTGSSNYTSGITLLDGQRLFGQGASTANLGTLTGITFNPNSLTLPTAGGTDPVITNAAGDGILLASGNTVRGLNIGACSDFGIDDNGAVGTLTISEVDINTTGGGFRTDNGGTLAVTLGAVTAGGIRGIHLAGTAGSFSVTGATTTSSTTNHGIWIDNTSTNVSFAAITISSTGSGSNAFELSGNTGTFNASGTTTVNAPVAGGVVSLLISGGSGTTTFAAIDINGRRDIGISIESATNVTTGTVDIDNTNSVSGIVAFLISGQTGGSLNFGATTINNNGASLGVAVAIGNSNATITFASGSNITGTTTTGFSASQGSGSITYNGAITNIAGSAVSVTFRTGGTVAFTGNINSSGGTGITVGSNSGGVIVNFSGSTKSISSGSFPGVNLTTNTGATINFTNGGLTITSTSGTGFNATGGGTVTVQGTGNTISSTSGTALNVANTTIGASGLTFQSIASDGGSATGIILDNTGNGGLTITGTGGAGSGGTIANKTGANGSNTTGVGIYLNNCANVSLTRMQLNNFSNFGIRGFTVNNFTMDNCVVNHSSGKNGDDAATDEGSIYFGAENPGGTNGLTGTVSITNCLIEDGYENNFKIANLSGTLSQLTMTNCTIRDNSIASPGNNGFEIRAQGSANITADITNSTFTGNRANGIQVTTTPEHTGTVDVEIGVAGVALSGGTFTNNNIGINIAHGSPGILNFDIHRGTFNSNPGLASPININLAAGGVGGVGPMSGSITNNMITNANSGTGPGIRVNTNGTDADGSNVLTILVSNNIISQIGNRGIEMIARDGNSTLNATVTNNTVTLTDPLAADAIRIDAGTSSGDLTTVCLAISGNTATTIAGSNGIRIRNRFAGTTYRIPGYGGAATDPDGTHDAVIAYLSSLNPLTPMVTADHQVGNSGFTAGSPCATPN